METSTSDAPRVEPAVKVIAGPVAPAAVTIEVPTRDSDSCDEYAIAEIDWFISLAPTSTGTGCESSAHTPYRAPSQATLLWAPPAPLSPAKHANVDAEARTVTSCVDSVARAGCVVRVQLDAHASCCATSTSSHKLIAIPTHGDSGALGARVRNPHRTRISCASQVDINTPPNIVLRTECGSGQGAVRNLVARSF